MRPNINKFKTEIKKMKYQIKENIVLKSYTSLHIGGKALLMSTPNSIEEIKSVIITAKQCNIPYFILGNGSNVLIDDLGFNGLIIVTKTNFKSISINKDIISADAGANLKDVCLAAYNSSLSGLEFAYGIPATVGGAVYMNAGAYGGEIKDIIIECTYLDYEGNIHTLTKDQLNLSYRHSFFSNKNYVILQAKFKLNLSKKNEIKEKMDDYINRRMIKQPLEYPSAGSTFKRPKGNYASALIEQSGLKGFKHKNAMVSDKHAGFVINHNNANSKEFLELIDIIKKIVKEKTGYKLETEILIIPHNYSTK